MMIRADRSLESNNDTPRVDEAYKQIEIYPRASQKRRSESAKTQDAYS